MTPEDIWRKYDAVEARLTAPLSERMLELAGVRSGTRLLDLATGRGEPAIRAARKVGPDGVVVGVELSGSMLQMARERAAREGVANLELRVGDAQQLDGISAGDFDAVTCRWGLMYMAEPVEALRKARRALNAQGKLVAALWAEPERVPYFTLPRKLLERQRPISPPDFEAPGTFRYSDPARIEKDFREAGFEVASLEEMVVPVFEAEAAADVMEWTRAFGMAALLRDLPESVVQAWEEDMTRELEATRQGQRGRPIQLGGVTRIVVAVSGG